MFNEVREKLETLDTVLNQERYDKAIAWDGEIGFDSDAEEVDPRLKHDLLLRSIPLCKRTGKETSYLIIELRLEANGQKHTETYLRGFEETIDSHPLLADEFLREVGTLIGEHLEVPDRWPSKSMSCYEQGDKFFCN